MYVRIMSTGDLRAAVAAVVAAVDELAGCESDLATRAELVDVLDELETVWCRLPALRHRLLARLQVETTPQQMGAKNWKDVLAIRWRISTSEAHRRLTDAALLAPRQPVTGPPLPPVLHATAVAQELGLINAEHVEVIRKSVDKLPGFVDTTTREQFEVDLVRDAVGAGPSAVKDAADQRLFLLDQDGPAPDEHERARTRGVIKHQQRRDAMTDLAARLTPEAWAVWEVLFAKYAAPGMCNPDDAEPCTAGTPTQAQIDNDHRSLAQRQHDALLAVGRIALMSGEVGQLNGLPVSVIIRTTLQDLESRAGIGVTGGGTRMPIRDVIRMAGHANHYLAVFDRATGSALDLFRTRRVASRAQRIMLIARDGGCTKPCCTVGAYGAQAHHATTDWAKGGDTNINDLGLACPPDNRAVKEGGWSTAMNGRHEVEWTPPPDLDTGQTRVNTYHRPELLLRPPDDDEPAATAPPAAPDEPVAPTDAEPPTTADDPAQPGGPAPPGDQAA
ncbi:MAG: DUF222 domain-containing protein [Mycolicibacterium rufum]|nr:DUF222 domain-containing protein [Mycolicibacterium rufum]